MARRHDFLQATTQARRFYGAFLGDQKGGILILVAALMIPLVIAVGVAVDASRGYMLKARLGDAVDAAGLAATMSVTDEANFIADFEAIFYANLPASFMDAQITLNEPVVSDDEEIDVRAAWRARCLSCRARRSLPRADAQ